MPSPSMLLKQRKFNEALIVDHQQRVLFVHYKKKLFPRNNRTKSSTIDAAEGGFPLHRFSVRHSHTQGCCCFLLLLILKLS